MTTAPPQNSIRLDERSGAFCAGAAYAAVPGRILLSVIFLLSGFGKITQWSMFAGFLAAKGLPAPSLLLGLAVFAEVVGGLSLLLGAWTRIGAVGLTIYLIPTTLIFHNYWAYSDAAQHQDQLIHFLKNVAIIGGLLMTVACGAGPLSIDAARTKTAGGR